MYTSSDGTQKDVKDMNTEYLINALSKSLREVYNSRDIDEYNKHKINQEVLYVELTKRMDDFLTKKIESEWK